MLKSSHHEQKLTNSHTVPNSAATPSSTSLLSETFQLSESKENCIDLSVGKGYAQQVFRKNSTKQSVPSSVSEFGTELTNDNLSQAPSSSKEKDTKLFMMVPIETTKVSKRTLTTLK